jgi:hypothetical protein
MSNRLRAKRASLIFLLLLTLISCTEPRTERLDRVRSQVRNLLQLESFEYVYRDVVYIGEQRSFLGIQTVDRQVLFAVDIIVRAGVDFTRGFEIRSDSGDRNRIFVEIPRAEILLIDSDESSIHEYFVRERGGRVGWLEYGDEIEAVKARIEQDAVERGILTRAADNAAAIVRNLFELAGFSDVRVQFAPEETMRG